MMNPGARSVALLIICWFASIAAAEAAKPQRWAVIGTPALRELTTWDLLTVELGALEGIQLVERDRLDAVVRETSVSQLLGPADGAKRIQAGRVAGADVLVLLAEVREGGQRRVRIVLTDCVLGVRLSTDVLPFPALAASKQEQFARDVRAIAVRTRERFPQGVKWVIGMTPFASKDLSHQHDAMQAGSALLVGNALSTVPGVAVIETEEAHAIRNEQDLTGVRQDRPRQVVPLIVRGEYSYAGDNVTFDVTLDAGGAAKSIREADLPPAGAAAFLSDRLPKAILAATTSGGQPPSIDQQFAMLAERADRLSALGAWELAVRLHNAALVLKPDSTPQRAAVVRDTGRWLAAQTNAFWSGVSRNPQLNAVFRPAWDRAAADLEYLIRNRKVTSSEAIVLSRSLARAAVAFDADVNKAIQPFLTDVYPLVLATVPPDAPERRAHAKQWLETLVEAAGLWEREVRYSGLNRQELFKLLEALAPTDAVDSDVLARRVRATVRSIDPFSPIDETFLNQIAKSKKPALNWTGRYALLWRRYMDKWSDAELYLVEAEALQAEMAKANGGSPSVLMRNVNELVQTLKYAATAIKTGKTPNFSEPLKYQPAAREIDGEPVLPREPIVGKIRYTSIPFHQDDNGAEAAYLVSCNKTLDVFWIAGSISFYPIDAKLPKVVQVAAEDEFCDAAWDGQRLWAATGKNGLLLYSATGERIGQIGKADGLPDGECGIRLLALDDSRMLVVGSFGPEMRAWCAVVQWDGQRGKVNVFHQARNAANRADAGVDVLFDSELTFRPLWMREYARSQDGKQRTVLVGRAAVPEASARFPLQIDVPSMRVGVMDLGLEGADLPAMRLNQGKFDEPMQNFVFLSDGSVLLPDGEGIRQYARAGERLPGGQPWRRICTLDTQISRGFVTRKGVPSFEYHDPALWQWRNTVAEYQGALYYPGPTWIRIDLATLQVVRLTDRLHDHQYAVGTSAARGLLMWNGSQLWQVSIEESPSTRPASQP
jgi:hypothetical protein